MEERMMRKMVWSVWAVSLAGAVYFCAIRRHSLADRLSGPVELRDYGVLTGNETMEVWTALQAGHDRRQVVCGEPSTWARIIVRHDPNPTPPPEGK
jgi:hypothetical protein